MSQISASCVQKPLACPTATEGRRDCHVVKIFLPWLLIWDSHVWVPIWDPHMRISARKCRFVKVICGIMFSCFLIHQRFFFLPAVFLTRLFYSTKWKKQSKLKNSDNLNKLYMMDKLRKYWDYRFCDTCKLEMPPEIFNYLNLIQ